MKTRIIEKTLNDGSKWYVPQYKWLNLFWKTYQGTYGCFAGEIIFDQGFPTLEECRNYLDSQNIEKVNPRGTHSTRVFEEKEY